MFFDQEMSITKARKKYPVQNSLLLAFFQIVDRKLKIGIRSGCNHLL